MEEAETRIRQVVKYEFFQKTPKAAIDRMVVKIIADALRDVKIPALQQAAVRSLLNFYSRQYNELQRSFGWQTSLFAAVMLLNNKNATGGTIKPTQAQKVQAVATLRAAGFQPPVDVSRGNMRILGVPMQKFTEDYMRDNVRPALERLAKQFPVDPDSHNRRVSLRNRAEFEVRGQWQRDQIAQLKASGVKLVICSTHADCSERCRPYQGRVYSLDGTTGTTDDGRHYDPLEAATNNPRDQYKTKSGKIYQNGLLGFNCRHFLVPYKTGYYFPEPNKDEEERQYAITEEQRRLERLVRKWRTKAVTDQGQDGKNYETAKAKAEFYNNLYIKFSKSNNRPYYPSRTRIFQMYGHKI